MSLLLQTDGNMSAQPSASMDGSCGDGAKRQSVAGGKRSLESQSGAPTEEMKVLTASCFLDFSFIEATSIAYLIQDPGNLGPVPDPTHHPEQLIPPDPAPRYRKGVLSSLARL